MPRPMHPTRAAVAHASLVLNNAIQARDNAIAQAVPQYPALKAEIKEGAAQLKSKRTALAECKDMVQQITDQHDEVISQASIALDQARAARKAHIAANPPRRKKASEPAPAATESLGE